MGAPGIAEACAAGCDMMTAQMGLLQQLAPRLEALPSVKSVSINKSSVPVIALTFALPGPRAPGLPDELHLDVSLHSELHAGLQAVREVLGDNRAVGLQQQVSSPTPLPCNSS